MISAECSCNSKYKNCNECPLKSREVFNDFARRLSHFYGWREVNVTFRRGDLNDVVNERKEFEVE